MSIFYSCRTCSVCLFYYYFLPASLFAPHKKCLNSMCYSQRAKAVEANGCFIYGRVCVSVHEFQWRVE